MNDIITLGHGSGGRKSQRLIDELFHQEFANVFLMEKGDAAILGNLSGNLAFTTDSYVITPIFFPGGDIGKLAICGTMNDLAVSGAKPLYISCGFIIEEGFKISELQRVVQSMAETAREAGVKIVTGDTKVVPKGACDKLFINTSGIGVVPAGIEYSRKKIMEKDKVILTGALGDHEAAILIARENFKIKASLKSDCAPLNAMLENITQLYGQNIRLMRDATRGGLASVLNEFVDKSSYSIVLNEGSIPIHQPVKGLCEMLGLEPLYMANEGKAVIIASSSVADSLLDTLHKERYGTDAAIIGDVIRDGKGRVTMIVETGGSRIVDMLVGEQLPRIC